MARRIRFWTRLLPVAFAALILTTLSGCSIYGGPQSVVPAHGDQMKTIWHLFVPIFWMSVVVFVIVQGLLIVAIIRFRRRPGGPPARQIHGNTKLELTWTIIPALVLAGIAVPTLTTIAKFAQTPPNAITVRVVGHQWWWEFQYPEYGVTTADEAHIPVGVPINWQLESADVIHSFWVPNLAGKTDVIPGNHNHMSFMAEAAGTYLGQCAEFCGIQHANMRFQVVAQATTDFCAWVAHQTQAAIDPKTGLPIAGASAATPTAGAAGSAPAGICAGTSVPSVAVATPQATPTGPLQANPSANQQQAAIQGEQIFKSTGTCSFCHTINGITLAAASCPYSTHCPDLTHFGERNCIAGCVLPNTPANLAAWLSDPQAVKHGNDMRIPKLNDQQVTDLVAFLEGLK